MGGTPEAFCPVVQRRAVDRPEKAADSPARNWSWGQEIRSSAAIRKWNGYHA